MEQGQRDVWTPRSWVARRDRVLTVLGLAAALAGGALGIAQSSVTVGLGSAGYRLDGSLLTPVGPGGYAGGGAVAIVHTAGSTRAAGSGVYRGQHMTGMCAMQDDGLVERCLFTIGGRSATAVDRKTEGAWDRRYDDGRQVKITLVGGTSVPVPFPIGY